MGIKKQPDPKSATLSEGAYDWFRNFLNLLEIYMSETGQGLPYDPGALAIRSANESNSSMVLLGVNVISST